MMLSTRRKMILSTAVILSAGSLVLILLVAAAAQTAVLLSVYCTGVVLSGYFIFYFLNKKHLAEMENLQREKKMFLEKTSAANNKTWRSVISSIGFPAILLNEKLRIVDINRAAFEAFESNNLTEGAHLLDVMNDKRLINIISSMINKIETGSFDLVRERYNENKITLFSVDIVCSDVRYCVICGR